MIRVLSAVFFLAAGILCLPSFAHAQGKFNSKIKIGDPAPVFTQLPGIDGKTHSLSELKDKEVVVIVFTSNHCPFATDYEDRLIGFTKKYAGPGSKVALVGISVNDLEEDKLPKMVERAKEKGFNFMYLRDESQKIGRDFGATVTPDFYVLNKDRKVVYMGSMDDDFDADKVKEHYLINAVQAVLKGQTPAVAETRSAGCSIEYKRKK